MPPSDQDCPDCGVRLWQSPYLSTPICVAADCPSILKTYNPHTWWAWAHWRSRDFGWKMGRLTIYANFPLWRPSYGLGWAWIGFTWLNGGGHELVLGWPMIRVLSDGPKA